MARGAVTNEQIRRFRLHTHHLDAWYQKADLEAVAGACGLQNSPPGAWESALANRIPGYTPDEMRALLEADKTLLQAWSFRGAPVVFPAGQSGAFLSALAALPGEAWIYTQGIGLALDALRMPEDALLGLLVSVMPKLDGRTVKSKAVLDQTLADWVLPLLPEDKKDAWNAPSMYGSGQTVGGAVVSFLLRPCAFLGLVVFGRREGASPTFTSYQSWLGRPLAPAPGDARALVRKYLHCYGPATQAGLAGWLGCTPAQAARLWQAVADEVTPVPMATGRERTILADDEALLYDPPPPQRRLHLLAGHDPYLGLQDKAAILEDKARQKLVWQTVSNPGTVLWQGAVAGLWKARKKGKTLELDVTLWDGAPHGEIEDEAERLAAGRRLALEKVTYTT